MKYCAFKPSEREIIPILKAEYLSFSGKQNMYLKRIVRLHFFELLQSVVAEPVKILFAAMQNSRMEEGGDYSRLICSNF